MSEMSIPSKWHHTPIFLIAGSAVIGGVILTSVNWWFILLTAAGTFGPGLLREFGWLNDRDEFQRRADQRAGYHAFLITGIVAFVFLAFFRSADRDVKNPEELATLFLSLLWFTWFFSSLLAYWGPQKTAARVLISFGSAWLLFTIVANTGSEWLGWTAILIQPLLAVPFFALAWLSRRFPRISGILLLAVSIFFVRFMGWFQGGERGIINESVTFILFVGPLLGSGVALLAMGRQPDLPRDSE